mmetsp:Transcript_16329/g.42433  ORF Transcript_16329/g.42433 Transcript_16329/m.42433 type:complete len:389 (-) Transcript_16329:109-1275(-)
METVMPVGRCVMRTADSVVLTCCPPAPEARKTSTRISDSFSCTSTSSASGMTTTVAVDVWMRPAVSVVGTRCTRWTPFSHFRWLYTLPPDSEALALLMPLVLPSPILVTSRSSKRQPCVPAYFLYMLYRSAAKRPASSPPVPARTSRMTFFASSLSLGSSSSTMLPSTSPNCASSSRRSDAAISRISASSSPSRSIWASPSSSSRSASSSACSCTTASSPLSSFPRAAKSCGEQSGCASWSQIWACRSFMPRSFSTTASVTRSEPAEVESVCRGGVRAPGVVRSCARPWIGPGHKEPATGRSATSHRRWRLRKAGGPSAAEVPSGASPAALQLALALALALPLPLPCVRRASSPSALRRAAAPWRDEPHIARYNCRHCAAAKVARSEL